MRVIRYALLLLCVLVAVGPRLFERSDAVAMGALPACDGAACKTRGHCFVAGTLVATPAGERPIESLEAGDLVLARGESDGAIAPRRIVRTFTRGAPSLVDVRLMTVDGERETVRSTPEHPYFTLDRGWVAAGELRENESLVDRAGRDVRITEVVPIAQEASVYNIEVEADHTYFVGRAAVWVHNQCTRDDPAPQKPGGSRPGSPEETRGGTKPPPGLEGSRGLPSGKGKGFGGKKPGDTPPPPSPTPGATPPPAGSAKPSPGSSPPPPESSGQKRKREDSIPSIDCSKTGNKNYVYRAVRPEEDPEEGLKPKNSNANKTVIEHVRDGSKKGVTTQYISTSKNYPITKEKYGKNGGTVVAIDVSKLDAANVKDLSTYEKRLQNGFEKGWTGCRSTTTVKKGQAGCEENADDMKLGKDNMAHNFANKDEEVLVAKGVPKDAIAGICR